MAVEPYPSGPPKGFKTEKEYLEWCGSNEVQLDERVQRIRWCLEDLGHCGVNPRYSKDDNGRGRWHFCCQTQGMTNLLNTVYDLAVDQIEYDRFAERICEYDLRRVRAKKNQPKKRGMDERRSRILASYKKWAVNLKARRREFVELLLMQHRGERGFSRSRINNSVQEFEESLAATASELKKTGCKGRRLEELVFQKRKDDPGVSLNTVKRALRGHGLS